MLARIRSAALFGVDAVPVEIQLDLSPACVYDPRLGLPDHPQVSTGRVWRMQGLYLESMPCHTPKIFGTVSHVETGKVVRQLGPYANAAAARRAVHAFTGQDMTWERTAEKCPLMLQMMMASLK